MKWVGFSSVCSRTANVSPVAGSAHDWSADTILFLQVAIYFRVVVFEVSRACDYVCSLDAISWF